jgi:hypothetical protein
MVKGSIEWEYDAEKGLVLRINPVPGVLAGGEVRQHMLSARKEMLIALKSIIDVAVKHMEEKESRTQEGSTRIKVE